MTGGLEALSERLRQFAAERDWEQFHSPKNLAMALAGEVGELLEVFQWLTEEQSRRLSAPELARAREELADVLIYVVRLAGVLQIPLVAAAQDKIAINEVKYPVEESRGNARKSPLRPE